MAFEDFTSKESVVVVYTGEGKGKTSAGLGLCVRALGAGWKVCFVQFIKYWDVSEHEFMKTISKEAYKDKLFFYKGGKGFYAAGDLSAGDVSAAQHSQAAEDTFKYALEAASSGKYRLVVCDEVNNAVHDGLLPKSALTKLIEKKSAKTSLCFTGRDFPEDLIEKVDIATNMSKLKHHFDDKFLANKGIDF